ncbi:tetratricopeptide repeat protein [Patescibacteria group bacterium]|nr:tetratricopeptide repeat protein [Patescibacteria group bacterium]
MKKSESKKPKNTLSEIIREKIGKYLKFPSIYRFITEKPWFTIFASIAVLLGIIFLSLNLYKNIQIKNNVEAERQKLTSDVQFWESIVHKYKGYRDAYFKLAVLEYQLKDFDKSKEYLNQAIKLDPNFKDANELKELLRKEAK